VPTINRKIAAPSESAAAKRSALAVSRSLAASRARSVASSGNEQGEKYDAGHGQRVRDALLGHANAPNPAASNAKT
jgi:hypothetical protein